ncbi:hypothetical protein ACFYN0_34770 [Streptomyces sp. NPDC006704]
MTDDEMADVLRDGIGSYLTEVDEDDLDAEDLAWTLVRALNRASRRRAT